MNKKQMYKSRNLFNEYGTMYGVQFYPSDEGKWTRDEVEEEARKANEVGDIWAQVRIL